ncbi:elongation factor G [Flaviaesturariibacter flavus]|uniref:Elongation factor G n=1 Tax=Flaviaesturariibacter flavus TaxID=2502780 RepID=A0A4R1BPC8_9BACT|nr:elongation factor G [Flaviaesturariibacter flavus]TCJ19206.1 elongation factor G [Flaviaesturariibacter flavus]
MAEFDTAHVRNIVLLGHAGAGKTTLAECMLFEAGLTSRRGSVAEGNTVGDFHELEHERGNSIFSKLMHTRWRGYKINILDTPGYDDFVGEVLSALRVADTGVMLLNAVGGVEVGTDVIWQYTERFRTPMLFAVNKLDHDKADFDRTVQEAREHFGRRVVMVQYPLQTGAGFHEIVDVLHMTLYKFRDTGGKPEKLPIPEGDRTRAEALHRELVEAIAAVDETLMEHYFDKGELEEDELKAGLRAAMIAHELFPLFCLSAERNMGSGRIMGFIDNVCPSACELPAPVSKSGEKVECSAEAPPCVFIYKTVSEAHVGDLSFFKVFSGTIRQGMDLVNESNGVVEKLGQLFLMEGNKRIPVQELVAGDIGATLKLRNTHVNNTLHARGKNYELLPIEFPAPNMTVAIEAVKKGEEEKLASALHQLREEDPTLIVEVSPELHQTLLHCQGDMHLAVARWKIEHGQKLEVRFDRPRIPYRETIRSSAEALYRHKKQSGGAGQFAEVQLRIEPWYEGMPDPAGLNVRGREVLELPWGGQLAFYNCIVGGAIDARFLPSILKGVMEKMQEGPLTGSHVRDVRVSVFDGKMHPVDSNDISFKIAGMMAFRQAFPEAAPQVLEPVQQVEVLCPDDLTGAVMGELQSRRGVVEGIDSEGSFRKINARVPLAELHDFSSALRSITQGRAKFSMHFADYQPMSFELQKRLTEAYRHHEMEALA